MTMPIADDKNTFLGRFDAQFGARDHLVVRGNYYNRFLPSDGVINHPSRGTKKDIASVFGHGELVARQHQQAAAGS